MTDGPRELVIVVALLAVGFCVDEARSLARMRRRERLAGVGRSDERGDRRSRRAPARLDRRALDAVAMLAAGVVGARLAGPVGLVAGAVGALGARRALRRRTAGRRAGLLERELSELVEAVALAVRTGQSIPLALEFAANEVNEPLRALLREALAERDLGVPFDEVLARLADRLGSDDGRLFVLIMTIHTRSGGDIAGALDEVGATIRHRALVRRELRALSAQGRISGTVLGILPIAFFLVFAVTSHGDLAPVYRSAVGIAMIGGGLLLQGLAYLWIRKLLDVEI